MAARRHGNQGRRLGFICWGLCALVCSWTPAEAAPTEPTPAEARWLADAKARIDGNWIRSFLRDCETQLSPQHPINRRQPTTVLNLTLAPDGALLGVEIHQPSGVEGFDASAKEVVSASGPFPEAPAEILAEDGRVHVRWPLHRGMDAARAARGELRTLGWDAARAVPAFIAQGRWRLALQRALEEAGRGEGSGLLVLDVLAAAVEAHWKAGEGRLHLLRAAALAGGPGPWPQRLRAQLDVSAPSPRRAIAVHWAAATEDVASRTALEELALSSDVELAVPAQRALMRLGDTEALWSRVGQRVEGLDADVRRAAVAAALSPKAAVEDMINLLNTRPKVKTREAAAEALGAASRFGGLRWEVGARGCLADGRASVHIGLLRGFARSRVSAAAYAMVLPLLNSHDLKVRAAAVAAAPVVGAGLGKTRVLKMCSKTGRKPVRAACVDALLVSGARARSRLRRWVDDADPVVRALTRARLVALDDPEVMPRLAAIDEWPEAQWVDAFRARYRYLWTAKGPKAALEAMAKRIDGAEGDDRVREVAAAWAALVQVVGTRR